MTHRWSRWPLLLTVLLFGPAAGTASGDAGWPAAQVASAVTAGAPDQSASVATYDLSADERRGGHTLARHVGRTDAQLRDRLEGERISAASTYPDRATAERVVAAALARNQRRLEQWLARKGRRPNLVLDYSSPNGAVIGRSLRRGDREPVPCRAAVVVLRWDRGSRYYVLTSYPEAKAR